MRERFVPPEVHESEPQSVCFVERMIVPDARKSIADDVVLFDETAGICVLADGVGSGACETAHLAAETIVNVFAHTKQDDAEVGLYNAVIQADRVLREDGDYQKTTCTAAVILPYVDESGLSRHRLYVAHVGDSRAYVYSKKDSTFECVTLDDSMFFQMMSIESERSYLFSLLLDTPDAVISSGVPGLSSIQQEFYTACTDDERNQLIQAIEQCISSVLTEGGEQNEQRRKQIQRFFSAHDTFVPAREWEEKGIRDMSQRAEHFLIYLWRSFRGSLANRLPFRDDVVRKLQEYSVDLDEGDVVLLCSDGLSDAGVSEQRMRDIISSLIDTPAQIPAALFRLAQESAQQHNPLYHSDDCSIAVMIPNKRVV